MAISIGCKMPDPASEFASSSIQSPTMSNQPVAIVTAASKGIGAACARRLAEDGFRVALMSRSPAIKDIADELGGRPVHVPE